MNTKIPTIVFNILNREALTGINKMPVTAKQHRIHRSDKQVGIGIVNLFNLNHSTSFNNLHTSHKVDNKTCVGCRVIKFVLAIFAMKPRTRHYAVARGHWQLTKSIQWHQ